MEDARRRPTDTGVPQGGVVSPLLANIYLHELDKYMECYTELSNWEHRKRKSQGLANFLYVRYADDFVVLCNGTREQAEAMRQELYEFLKAELKLELSMEKTKVTHVSEGFVFLGFLIERRIGTSGKWAPRIRIPEKAVEKVRGKIRAALAPASHKDSVNGKIRALNRIIGGWCRYYQTTSSSGYYFGKLSAELFWTMAHWLGRKHQMSIPRVMRQFYKGRAFRAGNLTLQMPQEFKPKLHRLRAIPNPYTSEDARIDREDLDNLGMEWTGTEGRSKGHRDRKDVVYQSNQGLCGICGNIVPWDNAILDHIKPRNSFDPPESGDKLENLQILHFDPCHLMKTKSDLQGSRRVR